MKTRAAKEKAEIQYLMVMGNETMRVYMIRNYMTLLGYQFLKSLIFYLLISSAKALKTGRHFFRGTP